MTELLRAGAQQLICRAVGTELQELLVQHSGLHTADGNADVARTMPIYPNLSRKQVWGQ